MRRAALWGAVVALLAAVFAVKAARKMPDFEVYWRAADRASRAEALYREEDGHYQLKYLPAFAVLAAPIAIVPLPAAKGLWFALSVSSLAGLVALSIRLLPDRRARLWVLAACSIAAMAKFYAHELVLGQINLLFGAIVTGAAVLLRARHEIAAGLLLGLAVIVKPYAVIFLPWLAATRRGPALLTAALVLAAALVLPVAVYGASGAWAQHVDWWRTVTESTAPNLLNADNVSVAAMYAKWLGMTPSARWLALATVAVLLAAAADVVRRRRTVARPEGLEAAVLLTLIPLVSPQGWDYVFLLATPAVVFLVNYRGEMPAALRVAVGAAIVVAGFSLFDVMGRRLYGAFMTLSIVTICFLVVIAALHALRTRGVA